jgi:hypothetical protein
VRRVVMISPSSSCGLIAQVLLKALLSLPASDYLQLIYILPEKAVRDVSPLKGLAPPNRSVDSNQQES